MSRQPDDNQGKRSWAYPRDWRRPATNLPGLAPVGNASGNDPDNEDSNGTTPGTQGVASSSASGNRRSRPHRGGHSTTAGNWRQDGNQAGGAGLGDDSDAGTVRTGDRTMGQPKKPRPFRPMDAVRTGHSANQNISAEERIKLGFSENYKGDVMNPNNRSGDIREEESTSLYFFNLPPDITIKTLLDRLNRWAPLGKVQQSNIKRPAPERGHYFAGAKVATFHRAEAEKIKKLAETDGLFFDSLRARVKWNTQKVRDFRETHPNKSYMSRAIMMTGPKEVVNVGSLYAFFANNFMFDVQDVFLLEEDETTRTINWVFASVQSQAEAAFLALKEPRWAEANLDFKYGPDPLSLTWEEVSQWRSLADDLPALGNFIRQETHGPAAQTWWNTGQAGGRQDHRARQQDADWFGRDMGNIYDAESGDEAEDQPGGPR